MTNTSTSINDATRALVTLMRARSGFRSCWARGNGTAVFHSAEIGLFDDQPNRGLIIADADDPARPDEAGQTRQRMATLGTRRARDEDATIHCRSWFTTGDAVDGSVQRCWDGAHAIIDELEALLSDSPNIGLVPTYRDLTCVLEAVTGVRPYSGAGVTVEVFCDLRVNARL